MSLKRMLIKHTEWGGIYTLTSAKYHNMSNLFPNCSTGLNFRRVEDKIRAINKTFVIQQCDINTTILNTCLKVFTSKHTFNLTNQPHRNFLT